MTALRRKRVRGSARLAKPYHHGDLRNALLTAARRRLETGGLDGLSLRALAKAAGVSHAAPAHHFGDRQGLVGALVGRGFEDLAAVIREAVATASTPFEALDAVGVAYVRFAADHPELFRLIVQRTPDLEASGDESGLRAAEDAQRLLAEVVANAWGSNDEPRAAVGRLAPVGDVAVGAPGPAAGAALPPAALLAWAGVHGLATLWIDGQLAPFFPGRGGKAAFLEAVRALLRSRGP